MLSRVIAVAIPVGRHGHSPGRATAPPLLYHGPRWGEAAAASAPAPTGAWLSVLYPQEPVAARGVTVVLYHATVRARANRHGQVTAHIHVAYAVRQRVEALLSVTTQTRRGRSTLRVRVTLAPTGHYTHEDNHTRVGH